VGKFVHQAFPSLHKIKEIQFMTLPVLTYPLSSQNQRVNGYEIPGDEQPRIYTTDNLLDNTEYDEIIWAAYRQIFNEQQMLRFNRQVALESQFRAGQLTVRELIRGLILSDSFRRLNYDSNTNYRFVEMCVQRVLGRRVYDNRETLSWSIVLATKGLTGFVDALLGSEEYLEQFGDGIVPYQRRRILPSQKQGELPFARMARHDRYHLNSSLDRRIIYGVSDRSAPIYRKILVLVPALASALLLITLVTAVAPQ
jgi:phycobilisome rod-core linker protein